MHLELAQYLRHLSVRCSCLSRDISDLRISNELVAISVELVERAETIEALLKVPNSPLDEAPDDS